LESCSKEKTNSIKIRCGIAENENRYRQNDGIIDKWILRGQQRDAMAIKAASTAPMMFVSSNWRYHLEKPGDIAASIIIFIMFGLLHI
jgi:hypothetical protein